MAQLIHKNHQEKPMRNQKICGGVAKAEEARQYPDRSEGTYPNEEPVLNLDVWEIYLAKGVNTLLNGHQAFNYAVGH